MPQNVITTKELISIIAHDTDSTKAKVTLILKSFVKKVPELISKSDKKVQIRGFGSFKKSLRKSRKGVDPKTRQTITIAEHTIMTFKAGSDTKKLN